MILKQQVYREDYRKYKNENRYLRNKQTEKISDNFRKKRCLSKKWIEKFTDHFKKKMDT